MRARVAVLWRRLLVLLIGGVIAVPYAAVIIWVITAWNRVADRGAALSILAIGIVSFALLCLPAFLAVIRALERTLAEQLLDLSIPIPPRRPRTADRARGALFYFGHAFTGALLLIAIVVMIPSAAVLTVDPGQIRELSNGLIGTPAEAESGGSFGGSSGGASSGSLAEGPTAMLPAALVQILAFGILLVLIAVIIAQGYFLPHYALILLGPSAADRAELAGTERARRFRRTVLAREVHDSIGHALTVTTMQAAVAKRSLQFDPTLAEAALDEIARTGREAVAELDHVLTLLRSEADAPLTEDPRSREPRNERPRTEKSRTEARRSEAGDEDDGSPRRTLRDIERLADEARSVGHPTQLSITGDAEALPPRLVHELHRIVREVLTNSLRHASAPGMSIDIAIDDGTVILETRNDCRTPNAATTGVGGSRGTSPTDGNTSPTDGSRGLEGISERVALFGGSVSWGAESGEWKLNAVLPIAAGRPADTQLPVDTGQWMDTGQPTDTGPPADARRAVRGEPSE